MWRFLRAYAKGAKKRRRKQGRNAPAPATPCSAAPFHDTSRGARRRFTHCAVLRRLAAILEISDMADNGDSANNEALPQLNVLAQYTKDLSFENPNAPKSLGPQEQGPNINIQVNVNARQLTEGEFEVNLVLEGSAEAKDAVLFKFELDYAGVFRVRNIPEAELHAVIMIECPRLLFPFARQIIADNVRNGGFPPLFIDPIDFVALYRQRMAEMQTANAVPN
jgi:preprotein translocase subunit SecB